MFVSPTIHRTAQRINDAHDWHAFGWGANDNPFFEIVALQQGDVAPGGCSASSPNMDPNPAGGDPQTKGGRLRS